jgi:hypothetical protein
MIEPCTYCGLPSDSIDHIPPQAMRAMIQDLGAYKGVWREVPACRWCNSHLADLALLTVEDRRQYIKKVLRKKFKKLLSLPDWTDAALAELGPSLRCFVIDSIHKAQIVKERLAWPS